MTDILELDLQFFAEDGDNAAGEDNNANHTEDGAQRQANEEDYSDSGNEPNEKDGKEHEESSQYDEDPFGGISDEVKKLVAQENHVDLEETADNEEAKLNKKADEPPDYKKLYEELKSKYEGTSQQAAQIIAQTADKNLNVNTGNVPNNNVPNMLANIKLTPEMSNAIEEMAYKRALQISGMNKDDVEALEYAEDGDANKTRFENAKTIARNSVLTDLNARYFQLEQMRQRHAYEQQQSASDIQDFVKEIKSVDNYQKVVDYVTKDYINTLPPLQQSAIRQAYTKADRGVSSIADNMILRGFWNRGMSAYKKANGSSRGKADRINNTMTQRNKFPRVGQVRDSSGSAQNEIWTLDRCTQLVNSGQIEKIPQNIKEQLMRGYLE